MFVFVRGRRERRAEDEDVPRFRGTAMRFGFGAASAFCQLSSVSTNSYNPQQRSQKSGIENEVLRRDESSIYLSRIVRSSSSFSYHPCEIGQSVSFVYSLTSPRRE